MNVEYLFTILSCLPFLLIQGSEPDDKTGNIITADGNRRILNGRPAIPSDFRYAVFLHTRNAHCGGSVIANYYILTAAHCIFGKQCDVIAIFPSNWVATSAAEVFAAQCYIHEKYAHPRSFYDIALLRTSKDVLTDNRFALIPLPDPGVISHPPGTYALIVGWGKTEPSSKLEGLLRGDTYVIDWDMCDTAYMNSYVPCGPNTEKLCPAEEIPKRVFCTQGRGTAPSGVCQGDSGGPVVIEGVLAGVVARALGTAEEPCIIGTPSMATNVADFLPWIYNIIEHGRKTSSIPVTAERF